MTDIVSPLPSLSYSEDVGRNAFSLNLLMVSWRDCFLNSVSEKSEEEGRLESSSTPGLGRLRITGDSSTVSESVVVVVATASSFTGSGASDSVSEVLGDLTIIFAGSASCTSSDSDSDELGDLMIIFVGSTICFASCDVLSAEMGCEKDIKGWDCCGMGLAMSRLVSKRSLHSVSESSSCIDSILLGGRVSSNFLTGSVEDSDAGTSLTIISSRSSCSVSFMRSSSLSDSGSPDSPSLLAW